MAIIRVSYSLSSYHIVLEYHYNWHWIWIKQEIHPLLKYQKYGTYMEGTQTKKWHPGKLVRYILIWLLCIRGMAIAVNAFFAARRSNSFTSSNYHCIRVRRWTNGRADGNAFGASQMTQKQTVGDRPCVNGELIGTHVRTINGPILDPTSLLTPNQGIEKSPFQI